MGRANPFRSWILRQRDPLIREGVIGLILVILAFTAATLWDARLAERQIILENTRFVRQVAIDNSSIKPFRGLDLRGVSLSGLALGCKDHEGEKPAGCADFTGADLRDADLNGVDLNGAKMGGAQLIGAQFSSANLRHSDMWHVDLSEADLSYADMRDAALVRANLDGAYMYRTNLRGATLSSASLVAADLGLADLSYTALNDADLRGSNLGLASLEGAYLANVDVRGAMLWTDFDGVDLRDICYDDSTIWPDDFAPPSPPTCGSGAGEGTIIIPIDPGKTSIPQIESD